MKRLTSGATLLAMLSAVAGTAAAQSSVTIYGVADAGVVHDSGAPAGNVTRVSSGVASGSRIGFRGKEDLGDGLSALFTLEAGYSIDTGASGQGGVLFGRQAFVGLSSTKAGTVTLGRQYSVRYKQLLNIADPFEIGLAGNANNIINVFNRINNQIEYVSPTFAGFSGDIAYGAGEVAGETGDNRSLGGAINYANGPLTASVTDFFQNDATGLNDQHFSMAAAKYAITPAFTVNLAHSVNRGQSTVANVHVKARSLQTLVGGSFSFGSNKILASYIRSNDTTGADRDAQQFGLGYLYSLTKRSDLYASYGHIRNDNGAAFVVGNATDTGTGSTGYNVGMRHRF